MTFDDEFVVHDIKIIEGQSGLFIAMPSRKLGEGDFRDIAHPLTSETRNRIKDAIFVEYEKLLEEAGVQAASAGGAEKPQPAGSESTATSEEPSFSASREATY